MVLQAAGSGGEVPGQQVSARVSCFGGSPGRDAPRSHGAHMPPSSTLSLPFGGRRCSSGSRQIKPGKHILINLKLRKISAFTPESC